MCLLITLFNVLINKKAGHLGKRKTDRSTRERTRKLHQNTQIHALKEKNFLYSNEGTIDYNQQCHPLHLGNKQYKQFPKKKKKKKKCEREERERKREREEERMRKRGRESEKKKKKEKKEEKEKEEEKIEKAVLKIHCSL